MLAREREIIRDERRELRRDAYALLRLLSLLDGLDIDDVDPLSLHVLTSEPESALPVIFPEVNPGPKPVVLVLARLEGIAS
jgi:hypothetical protein